MVLAQEPQQSMLPIMKSSAIAYASGWYMKISLSLAAQLLPIYPKFARSVPDISFRAKADAQALALNIG
jgi:hypothetical protein